MLFAILYNPKKQITPKNYHPINFKTKPKINNLGKLTKADAG